MNGCSRACRRGRARLASRAIRSFAHWLFVGFAVFAVAVLFLLLVALGVLGPDAQAGLLEWAKWIEDYYTGNKKFFDGALTAVGVVGSALTGVFAIYKSWYYAEFNLPRRLAEMIQRRDKWLFEARPALLASINDPLAERGSPRPIIFHFPIYRLLRDLRLGRARDAATNLIDAIEIHMSELQAVAARRAEIENEVVTGHLLRGSALAGQASMMPVSSEERRARNEEALLEFKAALGLIADDVDALMLYAKQSALLGDEGSALHHLDKMAAAAATKDKPIRRAQAFRLKAEILVKRDARREWDDARPTAIAAVDILYGMEETTAEKSLELVKALVVLGVVQTKREKFTAARNALDRANGLLLPLELPARAEIKEVLEAAYARLDAAEQDDEAPGE